MSNMKSQFVPIWRIVSWGVSCAIVADGLFYYFGARLPSYYLGGILLGLFICLLGFALNWAHYSQSLAHQWAEDHTAILLVVIAVLSIFGGLLYYHFMA
jgi:hypothetical protein